MDLLLLDTEGFAVANVSEAYDARIFAASTVLSSLLLYNSMHLIDAKELEYLDLLAHNTQLFSLKAATAAAAAAASSSSSAEEEPEAPAATDAAAAAAFALRDVFQLPPLLWAVQAFTLDLGEETCTSWLTRMLESATIAAGGSGGSSKGKGKGAPMRCVLRFWLVVMFVMEEVNQQGRSRLFGVRLGSGRSLVTQNKTKKQRPAAAAATAAAGPGGPLPVHGLRNALPPRHGPQRPPRPRPARPRHRPHPRCAARLTGLTRPITTPPCDRPND